MPELAQHVTATQAARLIGVNERTVRLWIEQKKMSATQPAPNRLSIPMSEVTRVIRERQEREELNQIPTPREMARQLEEVKEQLEEVRLHADPGAAVVDFGDINRMENRIGALEERITRLEAALYAGATSVRPVSSPVTNYQDKRPRVRESEEYQLPPGAVLLRDFVKSYGVPYPTARDHALKGIGRGEVKDFLEVTARPKPGRENETERYLTPEQQAAALAYWKRHGVPYQEPEEDNEE